MAIYSPTPFTVRRPGRLLSNVPGDMTYEVEDNIELFIKGLITKD